MKVKELFEQVLEEDDNEGIKKQIDQLEKRLDYLRRNQRNVNSGSEEDTDNENEIINVNRKINYLQKQLKESALEKIMKHKCNHCGYVFNLKADDIVADKQYKCPKCGKTFKIKMNLESQLSEMAADEKQRRIKSLQDQLTQVTDELRNVDQKDIARKQQITNKRFEVQKQLNTLRQIEVTK